MPQWYPALGVVPHRLAPREAAADATSAQREALPKRRNKASTSSSGPSTR